MEGESRRDTVRSSMSLKKRHRATLQAEDVHWITTILSTRNRKAAEETYRQLMRKYWKVVTVLVASRVGDTQEAEDIAQEAFLRAFRSLARLKEPTAFLGWLLQIARNLTTDHLRGRKTQISLDSLGEPERESFFLRRKVGAEPEDHLEIQEEFEEVLKALRKLPEKYQEVIALKYLKGMDGKTMAGHLGAPEGTIRNRLFRALEKLRETMQLKANL